MHVLADPFEDDFESLPPAVRRKFFSNLERFRLERMRLAQSHPRHPNQRSHAKRPLHTRHGRARTVAITSPFTSRHRSFPKKSSLRLKHPSDGMFLNQESWQCFHDLPPKIQQSHFSREEQLLLQRITPVGPIVDAADRALLKLEQSRRAPLSPDGISQNDIDNRRRSGTLPSDFPSTSSTDLPDSAIDMDESILDSFRWLDEDDLDLSLDSYHHHVADTAAASRQDIPSSPRRMPSFRRTMSFTRNRNSVAFSNHRALTSSQSSIVPFSGQSHRPTASRHVSHRSTSSIDPSAQYYQDPEARLKLRVYLASPQKFDEAVEFGFPSLENKENARSQIVTRDPKRISQISQSTQGWTFLDDDTSFELDFLNKTLTNNQDTGSKLRKISTEIRRPQPLQPLQPLPSTNAAGRRREMTLKMTLTRPDLRTADSSNMDDPLRLADLPPADEAVNIWDDLPEHEGVMRKMWRRLRGRKE